MALLEILTYPNPRLRERSVPVAEVDARIRQLIDDMFQTMYASAGVGLAAPQVGITERVIVVDCGARVESAPRDHDDQSEDNDEDEVLTPVEPLALINPEITAKTGNVLWPEGCLSVPGYTEEVERAERITVKALDRDGREFSLEADGLLAVCIQHEIDHLEGVLFVDRLSRLKQQLIKKRIKKQELHAL